MNNDIHIQTETENADRPPTNNLRIMARIILAALAVYALIVFTKDLMAGLLLFFFDPDTITFSVGQVTIWLIATAVYIAVVIYLLLYRGNYWAGRIARTSAPKSETNTSWLPVAFRLAAVSAGLLYLFWLIPHIIRVIGRRFPISDPDMAYRPLPIGTEQLLTWIILGALTIYLLCGAPHFVRWHVKKTTEQAKQQSLED